ncbi:PIN domain-containing protein [archaeon]|nr:PIN domain-containing protein [archaeon]
MVNYFFDSYAIIELLSRNPNYQKYLDFHLVTTFLNKIEVCWWALTRHNYNFADAVLVSLSKTVSVSDEIVKEALLFRKQNKKKDLSYADSIGYVFARKNNLLFLTGDQQFKELPGVEYVK